MEFIFLRPKKIIENNTAGHGSRTALGVMVSQIYKNPYFRGLINIYKVYCPLL